MKLLQLGRHTDVCRAACLLLVFFGSSICWAAADSGHERADGHAVDASHYVSKLRTALTTTGNVELELTVSPVPGAGAGKTRVIVSRVDQKTDATSVIATPVVSPAATSSWSIPVPAWKQGDAIAVRLVDLSVDEPAPTPACPAPDHLGPLYARIRTQRGLSFDSTCRVMCGPCGPDICCVTTCS